MDLILYLAAIVAANLTAATLVPLPFGLTTTVGTLLFGATFTLRDRLHRRGGRPLVYRAIAAAAPGADTLRSGRAATLHLDGAYIVAVGDTPPPPTTEGDPPCLPSTS